MKLRELIGRKATFRFGWLLPALLVMSLLEVLGVASIFPFMNLVSNPEVIQQNAWLQDLYTTLGFSTYQQLLISAGIAVLVLLTVANLFSVFVVWWQYKIAWDTAHDLATRLLWTYITHPYAYFLQNNTADLMKKILSEVSTLIAGIVLPLVDLIARTFILVILFALLLYVDTRLALVAFSILGGAYGLIYVTRRAYLHGLGERRLAANLMRYQTLNEVFSGIKTVQAQDTQLFFYQRFASASYMHNDTHPKVYLVANTPRYLIEILAFGGILGITLYLLITRQNVQGALPLLSLYALAGYRLLPSLQRVFASAAKLRNNWPVIDDFHTELEAGLHPPTDITTLPEPLSFTTRFGMEAVTFQYDGAEVPLLGGFSLTIDKGSRVAFVGSTGSGKTTLVDLMLGLLAPQKGRLVVDDMVLTEAGLPAWRRNIGYVPQEVFLYDDTVAHNIAFGVSEAEVEQARIEEAARQAQIHDFIVTDLPRGYETPIGERGVRLSGGQRQRLGLARALYRQPQILILDEATSALDGVTEQAVLDNLNALSPDLTIVMIAHRLATVRHCDVIYLLEAGRVTDAGTYDVLRDRNALFREMADRT